MLFNLLLEKHHRQINLGLAFILIIYPFSLIFQCGELTDTGFHAYNFQVFFENLGSNKIDFLGFTSCLIGALWLKAFPSLGILGLKLLYLVFLYASILITYLLLKHLIENKTILLTTMFCAITFSERYTNFCYQSDIISWFFLIATGFFAIKSFELKNFWFVFISGLLFGVAVLMRFSDIVFLLIFPFIIFYKNYYLEKNNLETKNSDTIKFFSYFNIGFIFTVLLFIIILSITNIKDIYFSNIEFFGGKVNNSHNPSNLLNSYLFELLRFVPHFIGVNLMLIVITFLYNRTRKTNKFFLFIFFCTLVFILIYLIYGGYSYASLNKYLIPAVCFLPLFYSIINKDKFSNYSIILCALALSQVSGTDTGLFLKLSFGSIALIPLSLIILLDKKEIVYNSIKLNTVLIAKLSIFLFTFFSIFSKFASVYGVGDGISIRFKAIYVVNNEKMKGILTTIERAKHIESLCNSIENNSNIDSKMLIFGHEPMFYYLTNRRCAVKRFWFANNAINTQELFADINNTIKSDNAFPLIIDLKQKRLGEKGEKSLRIFLNNHGYKLIEAKKDFNIWKNIKSI